jgi:hypothetical protein
MHFGASCFDQALQEADGVLFCLKMSGLQDEEVRMSEEGVIAHFACEVGIRAAPFGRTDKRSACAAAKGHTANLAGAIRVELNAGGV